MSTIDHQLGLLGATVQADLFRIWARDCLDKAEVGVRLDEVLSGGALYQPKRLSWCSQVGIDGFGIFAEIEVKAVRFKMRYIPAGSFLMGSPEYEEGRYGDEVQHEVQLTKGFWLCDVPCTQALWEAVMGDSSSAFKHPQFPVKWVSWKDCQVFLEALNKKLPGLEARLPTEAQWEYACRAGTTGARYGVLEDIAWYESNSVGRRHPVGQKDPNAWGLYDMLGNVWEWCVDWWGGHYRVLGTGVRVDPQGTEKDTRRVIRGGSWFDYMRTVRAACRFSYLPDSRYDFLGFRISRGV